MSDNNQDNTQENTQPQEPRGGGDSRAWARPKAMRRDEHTNAWLILLGITCLVAACWGILDRFYWRVKTRTSAREARKVERVADSFVAISYDGVTTNPEQGGDYISSAMFEKHVDALIQAGYTPVTLDDIAKFYHEKQLLPKKAILLTFENSRRSSYFTTRDILDKRGWYATMGVITSDVRKEVEGVILAPYLRNMMSGATWDLACESDHGAGDVLAGPDGRSALFYSSPEWLKKAERDTRRWASSGRASRATI